MPRDLKTAPKWCKDAIATVRGWEHPETGELLVSLKGLTVSETVTATKPVEPVVEPIEEVSKGVEPVIESPAEEVSPEPEVSTDVEVEEKSETVEESPAEEKPKAKAKRKPRAKKAK